MDTGAQNNQQLLFHERDNKFTAARDNKFTAARDNQVNTRSLVVIP